jgi:hypothetical protein
MIHRVSRDHRDDAGWLARRSRGCGEAWLGGYDLLEQYVSVLPPAPVDLDGPCVGLALNGRLFA